MIKKSYKTNLFIVIFVLIAVIAGILLLLIFYPDEKNIIPTADDTLWSESGVNEVSNANNMFAFDLYLELENANNENIFYSPYSISAALSMLYEGANGETADEIKDVFYLPESNILRPNYAYIYNSINKNDKNYELRTGNALWVQQDYPLLENYSNIIEKYYGGKATNLDFAMETEKSREIINNYISDMTNNKIKELLDRNSLNSMTRLVLTNAIYFKGNWEWEFDKSNTREQDFKLLDDSIVKVSMMHMEPDKTNFNYADLDKLQILELPYKDEEVSMFIILPKQGTTYDFETGEEISYDYGLDDIDISYEKYIEYKSEMKKTSLNSISIPKFEFETKYNLKETLMSMGMPQAFEPGNADFSNMNRAESVWVAFVIHQAYVKVDEKGTEAAAATAVGVVGNAMPMNYFLADHPFIFIIEENNSGNILFMGRVTDPTK